AGSARRLARGPFPWHPGRTRRAADGRAGAAGADAWPAGASDGSGATGTDIRRRPAAPAVRHWTVFVAVPVAAVAGECARLPTAADRGSSSDGRFDMRRRDRRTFVPSLSVVANLPRDPAHSYRRSHE